MDRPRLRTLLVMTAGLLAALAVASAGAILTFGLLQRETATYLGKSVRSVLLVEQLEAALRRLPATRAGDAEEASLRRLLSETSEVEQSPAEHAAVERLAGAVEVLLRERASGGSAPTLKAMLDSALAQDDALLQINLAQALAAESLAQRRARFSVGLAVAAAAGEVLAMAYLLLWAQRWLLAPLEGLRRGIARISQGESGVRVPEDAPEELREAALTLNAMARVIDEGAEGRASFLARVGEALKGPLQLIGASLDHLLISPPGASPDAVLNRVRTLQVQVGNLERVVHEFLDGARVEEGALALEPEPIDLRDLVRDGCGSHPEHESSFFPLPLRTRSRTRSLGLVPCAAPSPSKAGSGCGSGCGSGNVLIRMRTTPSATPSRSSGPRSPPRRSTSPSRQRRCPSSSTPCA